MAENNNTCFTCGACCIAYSISTLNKPAGVPCDKLLQNGKCGDYTNRPQVCRDFKADNLCVFISTLPLDKKTEILQQIYRQDENI